LSPELAANGAVERSFRIYSAVLETVQTDLRVER